MSLRESRGRLAQKFDIMQGLYMDCRSACRLLAICFSLTQISDIPPSATTLPTTSTIPDTPSIRDTALRNDSSLPHQIHTQPLTRSQRTIFVSFALTQHTGECTHPQNTQTSHILCLNLSISLFFHSTPLPPAALHSLDSATDVTWRGSLPEQDTNKSSTTSDNV